MLTSHLDAEKDHYKGLKVRIINQWTDDLNGEGDIIKNTDDISKLLSDFERKDVLSAAIKLDERRARFIRDKGFDKETQELQRPVTDQVIRSFRGDFLSAPKIGEWAAEEFRRRSTALNPEMAAYNDGKARNWMLHGRHYG
jgi:hypothetical protein